MYDLLTHPVCTISFYIILPFDLGLSGLEAVLNTNKSDFIIRRVREVQPRPRLRRQLADPDQESELRPDPESGPQIQRVNPNCYQIERVNPSSDQIEKESPVLEWVDEHPRVKRDRNGKGNAN